MGSDIFSLEQEVRCDFVVTEKRKKIWKTQIDIALEVKRLCEKYKIKYFIIWGTLLGAVRHKGYIPWDDDFDIAFLRRDYEKFCKKARKEIKEPLFFQDALSDPDYFIGYARIRNSETTGWILQNPSPRYNNGIFIDLYPLDVLPSNIYVWKVQAFVIKCLLNKLNNIRKENRVKYRIFVFLHKLCCVMFNGIKKPKKLGLLYSPNEIEAGYWFDAEDVKRTVRLTYENTSFSAPNGYKNILRNVYGDYMRFPPKAKRGKWHSNQIVFEPDMPYQEFYEKNMRRRGDK